VAALLASRTHTWLLFPLAFAALAAARVHLVSKNALTAAYAERVGLVNENALLSRVAAISATLAAIPGVLTGFLVLLIAFALRRADDPAYWLAILVGALAVGTFLGAFLAPRLAHDGREEAVMLGCLVLTALGALAASSQFSLPLLGVFVLLAGVASETARLGFQSLIQKEAGPGAEGRAYVRYEVRFQLAWVAGAFVPAMLPITFRPGLLVLAGIYAAVAVWITVRD
jgi:hypothetical protein